jgi:hypothetical protein
MKNKIEILVIVFTIFIAAILRFFNLMHDSPYFFDPDERNMAIAITQFRLPKNLSQIPPCLISQIRQKSTNLSAQDLAQQNCNLNPRFFAYGQFPLYLAYVSDQLTKPIINFTIQQPTTNNQQPASPAHLVAERAGGLTTFFPSAIFWLRFWSALASTLTVLFVYLISRKFLSFQFSILSSLMAAFSPGLIQSAHFGTTESFLTFFFLSSVYFSIKLFFSLSHPSTLSKVEGLGASLRNLFFLSLVIGLAIGSKLTGLLFFIPPVIAITLSFIKAMSIKRKKIHIVTLLHCYVLAFLFVGSLVFTAISSPYNLIDKQSFLGSVFGYESDVATGVYEAFYTRQFVATVPILFQAEKIFPYTLGWPVFILGSLGFLLINIQLIITSILTIISKYQISNIKDQRYKLNIKNKKLFAILYVFLIFDFSFLIYFLPNAFLFAKWTRFMTPLFPFFAIYSAFALNKLFSVLNRFRSQFSIFNYQFSNNNKSKNFQLNNSLVYWLIGLLVITSILPGLMFMSIYTHEDSRVTASKWIYENIPNNSYILSETANVVDIPLSIPNYQPTSPAGGPLINNYQVISFDFYHLDENHKIFDELLTHLARADYILIPSRRIFVNYTRLSGRYPLTTKYYQLLFSGKLGFEKVAEISSFPKLLGYSFPDEQAEETFTVFDHPVIRVYKKSVDHQVADYRQLFSDLK